MKHTAINIALFCGIIGIMFGIQNIDTKGYEHEVAKEEMKKQRMERIAAELCGNGNATVSPEGDVTCKVRKALKAGRASL